MRRSPAREIIGVLALIAPCLGTSCNSEVFRDSAEPRLDEVNDIRDSDELTPQQKRDALARRGFDPATINGILVGERTGNQFGGDLRTAFNKVVGGRLDEMTPDEVQIYADAVSEADNLNQELADDEADHTVRFFQAQGLTTRDSVNLFLQDPAAILPGGIPDDFLGAVFVDFDPNLLSSDLP